MLSLKNEGALITVAKMETDYEKLFAEGLNNAIDIADVGDTEMVEERSNDTNHVTKCYDCDAVCKGAEYVEDLIGVTKFGKHFGGCLKLECDEETKTAKVEQAENESDAENTEHLASLGVNDLGNEEHVNLELGYDDETELNKELSVVNIVPILDHALDTDADEYNECLVTSYTAGRIRSTKRIEVKSVHNDNRNESIQNTACSVVENPPRSDYLKLTSRDEKPSDIPNLDENSIHTIPPTLKFTVADNLSCLMGKTNFETALAQKSHMEVMHSKETADPFKLHLPKLYTCRFCSQGFTRKDNLEKHLAFHKDRKIHYCHICAAHFKSSFFLEGNVRLHMQMHDIKRGIKPIPEFLTDHVKVNLKNPLSYTCNICGIGYKILLQLLRHLVGHSNGGRHSCIVCAKEYVWETDIYMWICKSHLDICNICGEGNFKSENFGNHIKMHLGSFHNCLQCNQGFTRQETLNKHILSSHSRLQYGLSCHICHDLITVIDSDDITRHMDHHRTPIGNGVPDYVNAQIKLFSKDSEVFVCNLCSYSSAHQQTLVSHLLEHLKSDIACQDCGKEYLSQDELKEHERSRFAKGSCCVKMLVTKRNCSVYEEKQLPANKVKKVPQQHHDKNPSTFKALHTCPICEQTFSFSENLMKHKKVIHYERSLHPCLACDASFSLEEVKQHISQVHRDSIYGISEDMSSKIMTNSFGHRYAYICSICGIWHFGLKSIRRHLLLHPYSELRCYLCGIEFADKDHLLHHHSLLPSHVITNHSVYEEHPYCKLLDESVAICLNE